MENSLLNLPEKSNENGNNINKTISPWCLSSFSIIDTENPGRSIWSDDTIITDMDDFKEYLYDEVVFVKAVNLTTKSR